MRLAILFDHIGPYHSARIKAASESIEIIPIQVREKSIDYNWEQSDANSNICRTILSDSTSVKHLPDKLQTALDEISPDVVAIPGWSGPASFISASWALKRRTPIVVMSESSRHDMMRHRWREWIKRRYLSKTSAALVGGSLHRAYLRGLGVSDSEIFDGYDAVDNKYFSESSALLRETISETPPYFLASNRFIPKKNLFKLISAYRCYLNRNPFSNKPFIDSENTRYPHWSLCLLGDGELSSSVLQHAKNLGLSISHSAPWEFDEIDPGPRLFLPGFRQIDELPKFYAHASTFIHASLSEQWGLVVNEAMASQLPILLSNRCGCAPELLHESENGWLFDPNDVSELTALMERITLLPEAALKRMGSTSLNIISQWGPNRFATGLLAAANRAKEVGPKPSNLLDHLFLKILAR